MKWLPSSRELRQGMTPGPRIRQPSTDPHVCCCGDGRTWDRTGCMGLEYAIDRRSGPAERQKNARTPGSRRIGDPRGCETNLPGSTMTADVAALPVLARSRPFGV